MSAALIEACGIGKRYRRSAFGAGIRLPQFRRRRSDDGVPDDFWALEDIDLELKQCDSLGIIGPNGAGKSTLLKILSRVTRPTDGVLKVRGRVGALIEVGAGFHPELSGRDNIYINGAILGMSNAEIRRRFDEIVAFAELEDFIDTPVKKYSSGMYVRLGFAVAAHMDPDVLLVDEVLAVGDMSFRRRCFERMTEFRRSGGSLVFVTHDIVQMANLCSSALLLSEGRSSGRLAASEAQARYLDLAARSNTTSARGGLPGAAGTAVFVDSVRVNDDGSTGLASADNGGHLEVAIAVRNLGPRITAHVGVGFHTMGGTVVFGTNTHLDRQVCVLETGVNDVLFGWHDLPLAAGTYALAVTLHDEMMGVLEVLGPCRMIQVRASEIRAGLVMSEYSWRVPAAPSAAE